MIPSLDKSVLLLLEKFSHHMKLSFYTGYNEALVYPRDSRIEFKLDSGNVL